MEIQAYKKLKFLFYSFATFNLLTIVISLLISNYRLNSILPATSYGDFVRTDLFYVLAQGNFGSPWEFHPELPNLKTQPYFPLPFLVIKLFDIKVVSFSTDMFYVQAWTLGSILLINYLIWKMLKGYQISFKIITIIAFGVFSIPIAFIFTTGNLQGYVTIIIFLAFMSANSTKLSFISTILTISFKPQYTIINTAKYLNSFKKFKIYLLACFLGAVFSLFGFSLFGDGILVNIRYILSSAKMFTNPEPELLVHLNASLIGNLAAIETYLFPENIKNLISVRLSVFITFLILLISLYLLYKLAKIKNYSWPTIFILIGIPVFLTPVSYNYALTLLLIPLAILLKDFNKNDEFTQKVFQNQLNFILFSVALFLLFSPKPIYVAMIPKIADTNLYNMGDSFGYIIFLILIGRIIKTCSVPNLKSKSIKSY